MMRGGTPAAAEDTTRANGLSPSSLAFSSLMIKTAAAPSFRPGRIASGNRAAIFFEGRAQSAKRFHGSIPAWTLIGVYNNRITFALGILPGQSPGKLAAVNRGDGALIGTQGKSICSSRVISRIISAMFSAVSPISSVPCISFIFELG